MTKKYLLNNRNHNNIIYYCTNHRINTAYKKITFKNNPCNAKIVFKRNENNFYNKRKHNNICDNINPKIYDNVGDITENVYRYNDYKKNLLNYF